MIQVLASIQAHIKCQDPLAIFWHPLYCLVLIFVWEQDFSRLSCLCCVFGIRGLVSGFWHASLVQVQFRVEFLIHVHVLSMLCVVVYVGAHMACFGVDLPCAPLSCILWEHMAVIVCLLQICACPYTYTLIWHKTWCVHSPFGLSCLILLHFN